MMLDAAASAISGSFSRTSSTTRDRRGVDHASVTRPRGHTSRSNRTKGSVTSIGFAIRPRTNTAAIRKYRLSRGRRRYRRYAHTVSIQNSVLRTSFRSDTQATDSTWSGCAANSAATNALGPSRPVIAWSRPNRSSVFTMCSSRLVTWWGPALMPYICTSSMWDHQVSGCQLEAYPLVHAHLTPDPVRPPETCGLSSRYSGSSQVTNSWWTTGAYTAMLTAISATDTHRARPENSEVVREH